MIEVRPLRAEEWRLLREVRLAALGDAPLAFLAQLGTHEALPDEHWQDRALTSTAADQVLYVALDGERPVGMSGVFVRDGKPVVWGVWVHPGCRGSGVADRLLDGCEDWARRQGHDRITLEVNEPQARAARFYERRGYRPTGRTHPYEPDPRYTETELAKQL